MGARSFQNMNLLFLALLLGSLAVCLAAPPHKPKPKPHKSSSSSKHKPVPKPHKPSHPAPHKPKPKPHKRPTPKPAGLKTAPTPRPVPTGSPVPNAPLPPLAARAQLCTAMGQHVSDLSAIEASLQSRFPATDGSGGFRFTPYTVPGGSYFYQTYRFERLVVASADAASPIYADVVTYDSGNISVFDQPGMLDAATQYLTAVCSVNTSCAAYFGGSGMDIATAAAGLYEGNMAVVRQMLQTPGTVAQANNDQYTPLTSLSYLESCDSEYMGIHDWCTYLPGMTVKGTQLINFVSTLLNANIGKRAAAVEQFAFSVMMGRCSTDLDALSPDRVGHNAAVSDVGGFSLIRGSRPIQAPCQPHNHTCMLSYKLEAGQINGTIYTDTVAADACSDKISQLSKSYSAGQTACAVAGVAAFSNVASVWSFIKAGEAGTGSYLLSAVYNWFNLVLTVAGINLPVSNVIDVAVDFNDVTQVAAAIEAIVTLVALTGSPYGALLGLPGLLCAVFGLGVDVYNQAAAHCAGHCSFAECGLCAAACCSATVVGDFAFS